MEWAEQLLLLSAPYLSALLPLPLGFTPLTPGVGAAHHGDQPLPQDEPGHPSPVAVRCRSALCWGKSSLFPCR